MPDKPSTAAIILAAGRSSRMEHGQHKLLLPLGEKPVIAHVMEAVLASRARPLVVVLGHQAHRVRQVLSSYSINTALISIENPDYEQGMSTSLRVGLEILRSMDHTHSIDSTLVLLGDQPFVSPRVIDTLIERRIQSGREIIAPVYHGQRGTPVLFASSLFPELAEVTGDEGGKSVVARHTDLLEFVEISDTLAGHDVDTWEAYQLAVASWYEKYSD